MWSNRIWTSDPLPCGLMVCLLPHKLNWKSKKCPVTLSQETPQDRSQEMHKWKTSGSQTYLLVIFQMFWAASFLYLCFQLRESTVLMWLKIASIKFLGSFRLPSGGEVSWDFVCVFNCFLKAQLLYKKYFLVATLLYRTICTHTHTGIYFKL